MHNSSQVLSQYFETHEGDAVIDNKMFWPFVSFENHLKTNGTLS